MRMHLLATSAPFLLAAVAVAQSPWSLPTLETTLNSTAADAGPSLSFDGLTLHFASFRSGNWEIYSATRPFVGGPWSTPAVVTELADAAVDDQPFLAVGDLELWFTSSRAGGAGGSDILVSTRASTSSPWNPPTFVTELNSPNADAAISVTADGLEAYFLSTGWGAPTNNNVIVRATRVSTALPFGTPAIVAELQNANTHRDCEIAADGLSIVYTEFVSPRLRVLFASRPDRVSPFSPPVAWAEFDTVGPSLGVYGFTRAQTGDEAILAAGYAAAAGGQELMNTRRSVWYGAGCGAPAPLALSAPAPVLGANWDLTTTAVDPVSPLTITFFGTTETALPLDSFGAIGCTAYVDGSLGSLGAPVAAGVSVLTIPVPAAPSLAGFVLKSQSVCLTLGNPFGLYSSNAVSSLFGL